MNGGQIDGVCWKWVIWFLFNESGTRSPKLSWNKGRKSTAAVVISHNLLITSHHLVTFSRRLATMLFIASKGFPSRGFVTHPSLAVRALSCLTRDPTPGKPCPNIFLPVLSGGNADSIFLTISTRACSQFTYKQLYIKKQINVNNSLTFINIGHSSDSWLPLQTCWLVPSQFCTRPATVT